MKVPKQNFRSDWQAEAHTSDPFWKNPIIKDWKSAPSWSLVYP